MHWQLRPNRKIEWIHKFVLRYSRHVILQIPWQLRPTEKMSKVRQPPNLHRDNYCAQQQPAQYEMSWTWSPPNLIGWRGAGLSQDHKASLSMMFNMNVTFTNYIGKHGIPGAVLIMKPWRQSFETLDPSWCQLGAMFLLLNIHMYEVQTFKIHTIDIQTSTLT